MNTIVGPFFMKQCFECTHHINCKCGNISSVIIREHSIEKIKGTCFHNIKLFNPKKPVYSIQPQSIRIAEFEDVSVTCFSENVFEIYCLECGSKLIFMNAGKKGVVQFDEVTSYNLSTQNSRYGKTLNIYFPFQLRPYISLIKSTRIRVTPSLSTDELISEAPTKKKNKIMFSAPYGNRISQGVLY